MGCVKNVGEPKNIFMKFKESNRPGDALIGIVFLWLLRQFDQL